MCDLQASAPGTRLRAFIPLLRYGRPILLCRRPTLLDIALVVQGEPDCPSRVEPDRMFFVIYEA